jgi:hypothetical protein
MAMQTACSAYQPHRDNFRPLGPADPVRSILAASSPPAWRKLYPLPTARPVCRLVAAAVARVLAALREPYASVLSKAVLQKFSMRFRMASEMRLRPASVCLPDRKCPPCILHLERGRPSGPITTRARQLPPTLVRAPQGGAQVCLPAMIYRPKSLYRVRARRSRSRRFFALASSHNESRSMSMMHVRVEQKKSPSPTVLLKCLSEEKFAVVCRAPWSFRGKPCKIPRV